MTLLHLVINLGVVGVLTYLFNKYATPVDKKVKEVINIVVIAACVLYALHAFNILNEITGIPLK